MLLDGVRAVIAVVVEQHVDELAGLWATRCMLDGGGHVGLPVLQDYDERIAAHLDGCVVAGAGAVPFLRRQFEDRSPSTAFAFMTVALELQDHALLEEILRVADDVAPCAAGVAQALGWVRRACLVGVAQRLLAGGPSRRSLGLAACRLHAVDPGGLAGDVEEGSDERQVIEALGVAVATGSLEILPAARRIAEGDEQRAAAAAAAGVLLGDRVRALERLWAHVLMDPPRREFLELALRASHLRDAHTMLSSLPAAAGTTRMRVIGAGVAGDAKYVPWLITQMRSQALARVAGEAFSMITGVDIGVAGLDRARPEGFESGPSEEPEDPALEVDEDDGLPWPDPEKVERWWAAEASKFSTGVRYFVGGPPTRQRCVGVLRAGSQRQRVAAAHYLCLLEPGTPLFNTSAPAWRQQRLLAKM